KSTAIFGTACVEPEGERDRIPEQKIDLAPPQCEPRRLVARIAANFGLGKQSFKIRLVRGAGDDADLLSLEPLRQRILNRRIALGHETRRRAVIGIGEIDPVAYVHGCRDRRDRGIALVAVERRNERLKAAHLNGAGELELLAQHAREIDVEALRVTVRTAIVER